MAYVSVTQCLSVLNLQSGIPRKILDRAAKRGQEVHKYSLAYAQGFYLPVPPSIIHPVDEFKKWFDLAIDRVVAVEPEIKDPDMGLIGHPDLLCVFKPGYQYYAEGETSVVDLKNVLRLGKHVGLQLAGYHYLCRKKYGRKLNIAGRYAVHIPMDGPGRIVRFTDELDFNHFWYAFSLYNYLQ